MLTNMLTHRPNIQLDRSLHITESFAWKIVDQTMDVLDHDARKALQKELSGLGNYSFGNPKAQRKHYERMKKAIGPSLIAASLDYTGTSKRFSICFDCWGVLERHRGVSIYRITIMGQGANRPIRINAEPLAEISRHALLRIIQRTDFVRPEDLIATLAQSWKMLQLALVAAGSDPVRTMPKPGEQGWAVPVVLDNDEVVFFVVKGNPHLETGARLSVVTILDAEKVPNTHWFKPLEPFVELVKQRNNEELLRRQPELLQAFRETSSALWRNR